MSKLDEMFLQENPIEETKEYKVDKKSDDKVYITAYFDELCDLVLDNGKVRFLNNKGEMIDTFIKDDKTFRPPFQEDLDYLLPHFDGVIEEYSKHQCDTVTSDGSDSVQPSTPCKACKELYEELVNYHKSISELPSDYHYDLLALFDFHTYLIDKFDFSPILYFFADKERGKTRTAKGLIYVVRRGVMTETLREANLIRWSRDVRATLLFDVKNFARKLETSQAEDLVYGRAERGVVASRVLFPEKGAFKDTIRFEVFGPTIVTSNKMIDDIGLSRTILIEMKPSEKIFTFEPTKENGRKLREKLTGMRLAHMNQEFVKCEKEETGRIEDMLIGYKGMILTLLPDLLSNYYFIKKLAKQQKLESALDSFEAQLLLIITNNPLQVERGSLCMTYDFICSVFNEGKPERYHLTPQSLTKTLKGMGFESKRNSAGNKRGIWCDISLIEKLKKIYGLEDIEEVGSQNASESSDESVAQAQEIFQ